ncbi:hypothetical protein GLOIN_2v1768558 [Rhizophagus clarus]|uniref:Uncharacterized protein n=2 Tax=Rhizophagus clarus TaxID=94130 RepID=A0A8H3QTN4_9GLOM|nr:hypothetical protein GLOIN_2v1768558 [Rhizophagus clarus]
MYRTPVSPKNHPLVSGYSNSNSIIVEIWIFLEGSQEPVELTADINYVKNLNSNNMHIYPDTDLQILAKTAKVKNPLVVRYLLSNSSIIVKLRHVQHKEIQVKKKFEDAFEFDNLLNRTKPNKEEGRELKVQIKFRKAYSDWKIEDVLQKLYSRKSSILEIEDKQYVFETVNNEATAREFTSVFLVNAVKHVKEKNESTAKLMVEVDLKAKLYNVNEDIAQNLAQIYSAIELLGKQNIDEMPIVGIVTTGTSWVFIRHTGSIGSSRLEKSKELDFSFTDGMEGAKKIASYVVRLL